MRKCKEVLRVFEKQVNMSSNVKIGLCFLSLVLFSYISDLSGQVIEKNLGVIPAPQFVEIQEERFYTKQDEQMIILYEGMVAQKNAKLLQALLQENTIRIFR